MDNLKGLIILAMFMILCCAIGYYDGYYDGITHSMKYCDVSYKNGLVIIELDGYEFPHYVGE